MSSQPVTHRSITVGAHARPELAAALTELQVEDVTGGRCTATALFPNWGTTPDGFGILYPDRSIFDFGLRFTVVLGTSAGAHDVFHGSITSLEWRLDAAGPPMLAVLADNELPFRTTPRSRRFTDMSMADVVQAVAEENGLVSQLDAAGPRVGSVVQQAESDWAFISRLAADAGADAWVRDDVLHMVARKSRKAGPLLLKMGGALLQFHGRETQDDPRRPSVTTVASGMAVGDGRLYAGALIRVEGVGALLDGNYFVRHVVHTFDLDGGFRSRFAASRREDE